jgi:hypothetical protein
VKLRVSGTEAECARLCFLLRFGPPELAVVEVSPPYPNRGDSAQVRVYVEVQLTREPGPPAVTFYSLSTPHGGLLVDAWGREVES